MAHSETARAEDEQFLRRFGTLATGGMLSTGVIATAGLAATGDSDWVFPLLMAAFAAAGLALVRSNRVGAGMLLLGIGIAATTAAVELSVDDPVKRGVTTAPLILMVVVLAFVARARLVYAYSACAAAAFLAGAYDDAVRHSVSGAANRVAGELIFLAITVAVAIVLRTRTQRQQAELRASLDDVERLTALAANISGGDLSRSVDGQDRLSVVLRRMQDQLRRTVGGLQESVAVLVPASQQIASMAAQNEQMAGNQATALSGTRGTAEVLADTARQIAHSAGNVLEQAGDVATKNQAAEHSFQKMSAQHRHIGGMLETMNEVARKSEILALNAALEGHRAGEHGRGFSLVADEMRGLAEQSRASSEQIADLLEGLEAATRETEEGLRLARERTVQSTELLRAITQTTSMQQRATEELVATVAELEASGSQLSSSAEQTIHMARHLGDLSTRLEQLGAAFRV